jgi:hypothetical protein
MHPAA